MEQERVEKSVDLSDRTIRVFKWLVITTAVLAIANYVTVVVDIITGQSMKIIMPDVNAAIAFTATAFVSYRYTEALAALRVLMEVIRFKHENSDKE